MHTNTNFRINNGFFQLKLNLIVGQLVEHLAFRKRKAIKYVNMHRSEAQNITKKDILGSFNNVLVILQKCHSIKRYYFILLIFLNLRNI